jgi:hypothetical protein
MDILIRWKGSGLKTRRSDKEKELQKEGWGSSLTEEQIDKLEYAERKIAGIQDRTNPLFIRAENIDKVK